MSALKALTAVTHKLQLIDIHCFNNFVACGQDLPLPIHSS